MNSMLHRLLRKDGDAARRPVPHDSKATGCLGVLLAVSVVLAVALLSA